jgi:hypothetical protein
MEERLHGLRPVATLRIFMLDGGPISDNERVNEEERIDGEEEATGKKESCDSEGEEIAKESSERASQEAYRGQVKTCSQEKNRCRARAAETRSCQEDRIRR